MRTYQGSIITKTPITPSGTYQCGAASGVWTIDQMVGWQKAGLWPTAGNAYGTVGIFAIGNSTTTRNKYTYSGDVNASATASSATSQNSSAAGNSTVGIFALGYGSTTRDKYTYSGDVNASATAATAASSRGSAASNGTCGVNV